MINALSMSMKILHKTLFRAIISYVLEKIICFNCIFVKREMLASTKIKPVHMLLTFMTKEQIIKTRKKYCNSVIDFAD